MRQLHVVQCARHQRSRTAGRAGDVRRLDQSSSQAADAQSTSLGFATMARVFTPHPIQDRTDEEMRAYADAAFAAIVAAVTTEVEA